jgi:signal transduction histidine kinase
MKKAGVLRIVGIYFLFGSLWIIFSDTIVGWFVRNPRTIIEIAIFKGMLYIVITSALLFILIDRHVQQYCKAQDDLREEVLERRRTEEILRKSEELLSKKSQQLLEDDRRKDEFLAMLAHELRNPLSPIRTTVELLKLHPLVHEDPKINQWLAMMQRQVIHLAHIVDDLLDTSRISRGLIVLKPEWTNIQDSINQAMEMNKPLPEAQNKQQAVLLPPEGIMLRADPMRLVQILFNLINNALKYTPPGGVVALSARRDGDYVVVEVRDTGNGIPEDVLPRIFDLFYQADKSLDRSKGGLGLGLTLVKKLTDLHGGTVEAHSGGRNQGSVFTLRLPVGSPDPVDSPEDAKGERGS